MSLLFSPHHTATISMKRLLLSIGAVLFATMLSAQQRMYHHTVQAGETLYRLSVRYGVSVEQIKANNTWLSKRELQAGDDVLIPVVAHDDGIAGTDCRTMHKVKRKETLWSIAKQYDLTVEQLLAANPDISSQDEKLKKGSFLCIPYATAQRVTTATAAPQGYEQIRLAVVLPLLSNTLEAQRSVEFYRGLLMAVEQMKKRGTDVSIFTFDEPASGASMTTTLEKVKTADVQLLIGPLYPPHFTETAKAVQAQTDLKWLIPFSSKFDTDNANIFLLNAPEECKANLVAQLYIRTFGKAKAVFLQGTSANESGFAKFLRTALATSGCATVSLAANCPDADLRSALAAEGRTIFVPDFSQTQATNALIERLAKLRQDTPTAAFSLLGYPEWIGKGGLAQSKLFEADTYVFTNNYFNPYAETTRQFKADYERDFNASLIDVLPHMAPLGHDAGLYMMCGLKAFGKDFATQEVSANSFQSDLRFIRPKDGTGANINACTYFIHYGTNKLIHQISAQ